MFPNQPHTVNVEGRELPVASIIRRGGALAVDLCVSVLVAMVLLYAVSLAMPLDSGQARVPLFTIIFGVAVYLLWARDRILPSVGRHVFAMTLVKASGGVSGRLARPFTVYDVESSRDEMVRTGAGVCIVVAASLMSVFVFANALRSTSVFTAAADYVGQNPAFSSTFEPGGDLKPLPRAMLIGKLRAYLQADVLWPSMSTTGETETRAVTVDFFLSKRRKRDSWKVDGAAAATDVLFGEYGLKVPDDDVPVGVPLPPSPSPSGASGEGKPSG